MTPCTVLIVDDSGVTLDVTSRMLRSAGYQTLLAGGAHEAIEILTEQTVDMVITDFKMPCINGLELIRHVRENFPDIPIIMTTGFPSIDNAVEAMKLGAIDYLQKPYTKTEILNILDRVHRRQLLHNRNCTSALAQTYGIIGESRRMTEVFQQIAKAGQSDATILISGESGTGKELVARAIHYSSPRAKEPFIPVNCAAIPAPLFESELFGHQKGAFTGANATRDGFFQAAHRGSLFLDEIGETDPTVQAKLLRALQEKEVRMIGSHQSKTVDVRVIAATNQDLLRLIEQTRFRQDLFYRINVISIEVPPLRERCDDIIILAQHFLQKAANKYNKKVKNIPETIADILRNYPWPGNVRELENLAQRLTIMSDNDAISANDLPSHMRHTVTTTTKHLISLDEAEHNHIKFILRKAKGNKTQAAKILGIDRKTLRDKLNRGGPENTD